MGRTNPTFRDLLTSLEDDWQDYRRALRRPDQDRFDRLWEDARQHADAGGYLNHQNPMVVVLFSMLLAQEKRIEDLEAELEGGRSEATEADDAAS
ncbi:hypothetical protein M0R88_09090 [Halorussus gelatinilyticus]|uniref:DUF8156 domain-containing protein n=1 Tax=Halorussus gelatinilyticus TaxID=2937524 RepID=A0A8U0IM57_9EURY|nr:hypothetical protein [Halorussus gelatinilyticus]UPW02233.1 hypothetical protein M0R88_09090 [Halorussus gelatinilyticus]